MPYSAIIRNSLFLIFLKYFLYVSPLVLILTNCFDQFEVLFLVVFNVLLEVGVLLKEEEVFLLVLFLEVFLLLLLL